MGFYSWGRMATFFPVAFYRLPNSEMSTVLDCADFRIQYSPVRHMIPTIGLRFDFHRVRKTLAYSCDTEPCLQVVRLSEGADVLIHEAAGGFVGHSSAAQAGEIATQAEVALIPIYYPTGRFANGDLVTEARQNFRARWTWLKIS